MGTRFAHVNVIAQDWKRLAVFYETVFGCRRVPPERDQQGEWLDRAMDLPNAHLIGAHLLLPGSSLGGPTLEIYEYEDMPDRPPIRPNTPGFSHIAFGVDDVAGTAGRVIAEGGSTIGELTEVAVPGAGRLVFQYVADPDGNLIELQTWSP